MKYGTCVQVYSSRICPLIGWPQKYSVDTGAASVVVEHFRNRIPQCLVADLRPLQIRHNGKRIS